MIDALTYTPGIKLTAYGAIARASDASYPETLTAYAKEKKVQDQLVLAGPLPYAQLREGLYALCTLPACKPRDRQPR